ncbi:MAG: hypothetical protein ACPLTR_11470 [Thermacetogeniaceae bacterium]
MGLAFEVACEEIPADLETPVSVFMKTAEGEYSYLLESVEGGERVARYSIIGFDPLIIFRAKGDSVEIEGGGEKRWMRGNPLDALEHLMSSLRVGPLPAEPRFFGGAVGYFGYDLVRHLERFRSWPLTTSGCPTAILSSRERC